MSGSRSWVVAAVTLLLCAIASRADSPTAQPYAWQTIPFGGGGYVDGFVYHPKQKDLLYARTDIGGLYRFDFAQRRWMPLLDHIGPTEADNMGVLSIALDPKDPRKIAVATGLYLGSWAPKGAILRSSDQGATWLKTDLPVRVGGNADGRGTGDRLATDPNNGSVIFYGSNLDGLWKSTDGGKSFASAGSTAASISFVLFDPKSSDIYLGSADGEGALLISHDSGNTFGRVPGLPQMVPQHGAFASDGALYVTFAGSSATQAVNPSYAERGAVWKREPSGAWREITPLAPGKFGYSGVDVGPDGTLAVSTLDRWYPQDEIFLSRDGGAHWLTLSDKAQLDSSAYPWVQNAGDMKGRVGHWISDLKINPFNKDEMIYGTGGGVWTSRNLSAAGNGQTVAIAFNAANLEETATIQLASPPAGPAVLAAFGDVGGAAWSDITKSPASLFTPANESNWSIDFAGLKPSFLARTTSNDPTHAFLSNDSGQSWVAIASTPYKAPKPGENWRGPGMLAVSAKGTALLWVPEKDTAYFSRDNGKTWTASAGWPSGREQALQPVADKAFDGVFYVFDRHTMTLLISVDGGASFKSVGSGFPKVEGWESSQLAVVPGHVRDLWLALPYGLIHSPDSATPFTSVGDVSKAWAVGFGAPQAPGGYPAVYLSGRVKGIDGLWRSDDAGATWTRINDDAHQFGRVMQITGDPRQYGVVYIAPGGRGVMVGKPAK